MDAVMIFANIMVLMVLLIVATAFVRGISDFWCERAYLVKQINKSSSDRGERHWRRKLRQFYFSKIPVIGEHLKYRERR